MKATIKPVMQNTLPPHLSTRQNLEKAWELWNKIEELSQMLWEFHENFFIDKCLDEEYFAYNQGDDNA